MRAGGGTALKRELAGLLGGRLLYYGLDNTPGGAEARYAELAALATTALARAGAETEQAVFRRGGLAAQVGEVGSDVPPLGRHLRTDTDAGLGGEMLGVTGAGQYLRLLQYLAEAVNPGFQRATSAAAGPSGASTKAADTKTGRRMAVKKETDHKHAKHPRYAENVDMVRAAFGMPTPP